MVACQSGPQHRFTSHPTSKTKTAVAKRLPNHWSILLVKCLIHQFFVSVVHRQISWPSLGISKRKTVQQKKNSFNTPSRRGTRYNRYLLRKTEEGLYRLLPKHTSSNCRPRTELHPRRKRRSQKRVYLDDHGTRCAPDIPPTQRSNDPIAGLRVACAPVPGGFTGSTWSPSQMPTLYERAEL